ncbi:MAG TPA: hypothetical protein VJN02_10090 [Gammaproteobacteria bacterium]|nr:hypothetical protein [Gammaproteobacteria bacterium]
MRNRTPSRKKIPLIADSENNQQQLEKDQKEDRYALARPLIIKINLRLNKLKCALLKKVLENFKIRLIELKAAKRISKGIQSTNKLGETCIDLYQKILQSDKKQGEWGIFEENDLNEIINSCRMINDQLTLVNNAKLTLLEEFFNEINDCQILLRSRMRALPQLNATETAKLDNIKAFLNNYEKEVTDIIFQAREKINQIIEEKIEQELSVKNNLDGDACLLIDSVIQGLKYDFNDLIEKLFIKLKTELNTFMINFNDYRIKYATINSEHNKMNPLEHDQDQLQIWREQLTFIQKACLEAKESFLKNIVCLKENIKQFEAIRLNAKEEIEVWQPTMIYGIDSYHTNETQLTINEVIKKLEQQLNQKEKNLRTYVNYSKNTTNIYHVDSIRELIKKLLQATIDEEEKILLKGLLTLSNTLEAQLNSSNDQPPTASTETNSPEKAEKEINLSQASFNKEIDQLVNKAEQAINSQQQLSQLHGLLARKITMELKTPIELNIVKLKRQKEKARTTIEEIGVTILKKRDLLLIMLEKNLECKELTQTEIEPFSPDLLKECHLLLDPYNTLTTLLYQVQSLIIHITSEIDIAQNKKTEATNHSKPNKTEPLVQLPKNNPDPIEDQNNSMFNEKKALVQLLREEHDRIESQQENKGWKYTLFMSMDRTKAKCSALKLAREVAKRLQNINELNDFIADLIKNEAITQTRNKFNLLSHFCHNKSNFLSFFCSTTKIDLEKFIKNLEPVDQVSSKNEKQDNLEMTTF